MAKGKSYPRWIYYPNWCEPVEWVHGLIRVFSTNQNALDSRKAHKKSNLVLSIIRPELEKLGFIVEGGRVQTIKRPVHFGESGQADRSYQIDSFHPEKKIALEVEAGRTTRGNAIYRDIIQTSLLVDIRYFVIAVPQLYRFQSAGKEITDSTYETCKAIFDAIYSSERLRLPMDGILLIGY